MNKLIKKMVQKVEDRVVEGLTYFYENIAPRFKQKDIDKVYETLRRPMASVDADIRKFSSRYPVLKKLGAPGVGWILLQGTDVLHLALSLLNHPDVSPKSKAKLSAAIAYFLSPIDTIPEGILGPIGFVDDVLVVVWVIDSILNGQNAEEKELVQTLWRGKKVDLQKLRSFLGHFDVVKALGAWIRGSQKK